MVRLEFFGFLQKLAHALQKHSSTTAIDYPVIESQAKLRFRDGNKGAHFITPLWRLDASGQSEDERFVWKRNGRSPFQTEGAKISDRGNAA